MRDTLRNKKNYISREPLRLSTAGRFVDFCVVKRVGCVWTCGRDAELFCVIRVESL